MAVCGAPILFTKSSALSVDNITFPFLSFETLCLIISLVKMDLNKLLSPVRMASKSVLMACLIESAGVCWAKSSEVRKMQRLKMNTFFINNH